MGQLLCQMATDYYSRKKVHIIFFKKRFANADSMPIKLWEETNKVEVKLEVWTTIYRPSQRHGLCYPVFGKMFPSRSSEMGTTASVY